MFKQEWEKRKNIIENALLTELTKNSPLNKTLFQSMHYSLLAGGKRLRPILLMASADAVGGNGERYLQIACALEMIHTYSLIHDDLPAMDNDDYRRGKLTNHKVYGAGMATLAGDALLTMAFELITRQENIAPETMISVIKEISVAAGANGMVGGQAIDLESENKKVDMHTLKIMHTGKTGALFIAAIKSGAILAGASKEQIKCLVTFAEQFGLAFQITDDILDFTGDEAIIGKPVGSDTRNNKSTYVTLSSLDNAYYLAKQAIDNAKKAIAPLGNNAAFLNDITDYLITRNK